MIRRLLAGAVDYAGLFPPASLALPDAVRAYHAYRLGPDSWALGRFVVPVARLGELAAVAGQLSGDDTPWRLSALSGADAASDAAALTAFARRDQAGAWRAVADAVEARAASPVDVATIAGAFGRDVETFVEIPVDTDPSPLLDAIAAHGLRAKVRAGGITAAQFPSAAQMARFLAGCAQRDLAFKATAGLHHPLRAEYRLTYEPDSARGTMFGFLNVLLAAAAARAGADEQELADLLDEREPGAFTFHEDGAAWRSRRFARAFSPDDLSNARSRFALSFGSCSFEEPLADLRTMGLL